MNRTRLLVTAAMLALLPLVAVKGADAQALPDRIAQSKTIRVAVNTIYPPMEYKDPATGELVGFDIDLGNAIAKELGVTLDWQDSAFEQLLPSLATGRADMILSGLSDRPQRRETVDFIDYLNSGAQFVTLAQRAGEFKTPEDLCGKSVGSSRSTTFPKEIENWSTEHCVAAGKPAITVVGTEDTTAARAQLKQRRLDGSVQGSETIPYAMSLEPNVYQPMGVPFATTSQGIAFAKKDIALRDAVLKAVQKLMADGTYQAIIAKWKLEASAAKQITLNGAPLP